MGIPFFVVFVLSIVFLSLSITGWGDFVSIQRHQPEALDPTNGSISVIPYLSFQPNYWAMAKCFTGFVLFLATLYLMGFFLYLEERESGRIMKNIKSFVKLRRFLEKYQKGNSTK